MNIKFYGIRGSGFVHAACLPAFEQEHSRYDAQGRCVSRPQIDAELERAHLAHKQTCIHCGKSLRASSPYTPAGIVAGMNRRQKGDYRRMKGASRKTGMVLTFEHVGTSWSLELVDPCVADDPVTLRSRTILFDPRKELCNCI